MDPDLLAQACKLYQTTPSRLTTLSGGHYNAVYRFTQVRTSQVDPSRTNFNSGVLRIGLEDCPPEQTLGMLEWIRYLAEQGAPVSALIVSKEGRLLEQLQQGETAFTVTACEEVEGILAERIPPAEWTDELFRSIGQAAGKMHAVSKGYHPSSAELTRPQWFDSYEIHDVVERLRDTVDPGRNKLLALIDELKCLPQTPVDYGLIHDDLHFANFLVQPSGKVTIIDFDDCVYGWFAMDVAMALFDVLVLYRAKSEADNQAFAKTFMSAYLAGYRRENDLPASRLSLIPGFLKLKEICVYAPLIGHPEIDQPGTWVGDFMAGRAERIANDLPYVEVDFSVL